MKTKIYFIRHGNVHNPKKIVYGRLNHFGLSPVGRKEIETCCKRLPGGSIARIFTSPLLRARQSAQIIGKTLHLVPKVSRLLIETDEPFAGITTDEFHQRVEPVLYDGKMKVESIESQFQRMSLFCKKMCSLNEEQGIVAVSHGDPIMILYAQTTGIRFTYEFKMRNYLKTGTYLKAEIENHSFTWTRD